MRLSQPKATKGKVIYYFSGPPGVGKTVLANAIACALNIPIVNLKLDDLDTFQGSYSKTGWETLKSFTKADQQTLTLSEACDLCGEKSTLQLIVFDEIDKTLSNFHSGDRYRKFS